MGIDYQQLTFPKLDSKKEKRRRVRKRENNRITVAQAVRELDGCCMDKTCRCHKERDNPLALQLQACHIRPRRRNAPWLDKINNEITLCVIAHVKFDAGGEDPDGTYLTSLEYKDHVLSQWLGDDRYRWQDSHNEIRKKLGRDLV